MATHSSVLAWRIPGTGEPGRLLSMGLHRVGHNWSDLAVAAAISFSRPRDQTQVFCVSYIDRQILYHWGTREALWLARNLQSINVHLNYFLIQAAIRKGPLTLPWPKEIWNAFTSKAFQTISFNCLPMLLHKRFLRLSLKRLWLSTYWHAFSLLFSHLLRLMYPTATLRAVLWSGPQGRELGVASSQQPAKNWGPH